jgi:hypothetical protein
VLVIKRTPTVERSISWAWAIVRIAYGMALVTAAQPTIAIVGSADRDRAQELGIRNPDKARRAAVALGRELANKGLGIVVYSKRSPVHRG